MIKGYAVKIITKILDKYIENINPSDLEFNSGNISLDNLTLKEGALDGLDLPVSISVGKIGKMVLIIPWTSLKSASVVASITDLFIVVVPKKESKKLSRDEIQEYKQNRLSVYETLRLTKLTESENEKDEKIEIGSSEKSNWIGKLTESVIHNLQINIENVHIRYEDPERKTIFGVVMKNFIAYSCNSEWIKEYVDLDEYESNIFYKLAKLESLSLYKNSKFDEIEFFSKLEKEEMINKMRDLENIELNRYLIKPISGQARLKVQRNKFIDHKLPKISCEVVLNEVSMHLDDSQYKSILQLLSFFTTYKKKFDSQVLRPKEKPKDVESAKNWWRYLLSSSKKEISENFITFDRLMLRKRKKREYTDLFKLSKNLQWSPKKITPVEVEKLKILEEELDYEDIVYFRDFAYKEIELERKKHQEISKSRYWISSFIWSTNVVLEDKEKVELEKEFYQNFIDTEEDKKEKKVEDPNERPPEFIVLQFSLIVEGLDLTLSMVKEKKKEKIASASISGLKADFMKRKEEMVLKIKLQTIEALDLCTKNTIFPKFISRKVIPTSITESGTTNPLVDIKFVSNPIEENIDILVECKLDPLIIVLNLELLQRIISFFVIPKEINLKRISNFGWQQLSTFQKKAQARLVLSLEAKKITKISVDINAPKIIFPRSCVDKKTSLFLVNLGKLEVNSIDLITRKEREERLKKQKDFFQKNEGKNDFDYDIFYDNYLLDMSNFQVLFVSFKEYIQEENFQKKKNNLIEKVGLNLKLGKCITQKSLLCPDFIVQGELPVVKMNIRPKLLKNAILFANDFLLFLDDTTGKGSNILSKGKAKVFIEQFEETKESEKSTVIVNEEIFLVEMRTSGHLCLFKMKGNSRAEKASYQLQIGPFVKLTEMETKDSKGFVLSFPQDNYHIINAKIIILETVDPFDEWIHRIKSFIPFQEEKGKFWDKIEIDKVVEIAKETKEMNRKAILMKVNFVLKEFSVSAQYSPEKKSTIDLTLFQFSDLEVDVILRKYDFVCKWKLRSIALYDKIDPKNKFILSPITSQEGDVMSLKLISSKKESLLYEKTRGIMDIDVVFSEFNFIFDPKTLSHFMKFLYSLSDAMNSFKRPKSIEAFLEENSEKDEKKVVQKEESTKVINEEESTKKPIIFINAKMKKMGVEFVDFNEKFCEASMDDTSVVFETSKKRLKVSGTIGNLRVEDLTGESIHIKVMGVQENYSKNSLINFDYLQLKDEFLHNKSKPGFDKFLKIDLLGVRIVILQMFIRKFIEYFSRGPLMQTLREQSKKAGKVAMDAVRAQAKSIRLLKFDVNVNNGKVLFPVSHINLNTISGNLSNLKINNELIQFKEQFFERYNIDVSGVTLTTILGVNERDAWNKTNFQIKYMRSLNGIKISDTQIIFTSPEVTMDEEQYQLVFKIFEENFADPKGKQTSKKLYHRKKENVVELKSSNNQKKEIDITESENRVTVVIPSIKLTLLHSKNEENFAVLEIIDFNYSMKSLNSKNSQTQHLLTVKSLEGSDKRKNNFKFRKFIDSSERINDKKNQMLSFKATINEKTTEMDFQLHNPPKVILLLPLFLDIKDFFSDRFGAGYIKYREEEEKKIKKLEYIPEDNINEIEFFSDIYLGSNLILGKNTIIKIKEKGKKKIVIDGRGNMIIFQAENSKEKLIIIDEKIERVTFKNVLFVVPTFEDTQKVRESFQYFQKCENTYISFSVINGCWIYEDGSFTEKKIEIKKEEKEKTKIEREFRFSAHLSAFSIFLPSDLENINSKQFEVKIDKSELRYNQNAKAETGRFEIIKLCIFGFNEEKKEIRENILNPISLRCNLQRKITLGIPKRYVRVIILDDTVLKLTYQDVKRLKKIIDNISTNNKQNKIDDSDIEKSESDVSDDDDDDNDIMIEEKETFIESDDDSSYDEFEDATEIFQYDIKDAIKVRTDEGVNQANIVLNQKILETYLNIEILTNNNSLKFLAVDDVRGFDIPLVMLTAGDITLFETNIHNTVDNMAISVFLKFSALLECYNRKLADWEPLVEKAYLDITFDMYPGIEAQKESHYNPGTLSKKKKEDEKMFPNTMNLNVSLLKEFENIPLNVTVTQSMLETVKTTQKLWRDDFSREDAIVSRSFKPYVIKNHSGEDVEFWEVPSLQFLKKNLNHSKIAIIKRVIKEGEEIGVNFNSMSKGIVDSLRDNELKVTFSFVDKSLGFKDTTVNVKKIGSTIVRSSNRTNRKYSKYYRCVSISLDDGAKIITIRSGIFIKNSTNCDIEVSVVNNYSKRINDRFILKLIKPGEYLGVPMKYIHDYEISFRPVIGERKYNWNDEQSDKRSNNFLKLMKNPGKRRLLVFKNSDSSNGDYGDMFLYMETLFQINQEKSVPIAPYSLQKNNFRINLRPVISLENLLPYQVHIDFFQSIQTKKKTSATYSDQNEIPRSLKFIKQVFIERGEMIDINDVDIRNDTFIYIISPNPYCEGEEFRSTEKHMIIDNKKGNLYQIDLHLQDQKKNALNLLMDITYHNFGAHKKVTIYCPIWIINHTGLRLITWFKDINNIPRIAPGQGKRKIQRHSRESYTSIRPFFNSKEDFVICFGNNLFLLLPKINENAVAYCSGLNLMHSDGRMNKFSLVDGCFIVPTFEPTLCLQDVRSRVVLRKRNNLDEQKWKFEIVNNKCIIRNIGTNRYICYKKKFFKLRCVKKINMHCAIYFEKGTRYFYSQKDKEKDLSFNEKTKKILMMNLPKKDKEELAITVDESNRSRFFTVKNVGVPGSLTFKSGGRRLDIGFYVSLAPGKYKRTKIVTFSAKFRVFNKTKRTLIMKQMYTRKIFFIKSMEKMNLYYSTYVQNPRVKFKLDGYKYSSGYDPSRGLGEYYIIMFPEKKQNNKKVYILTATLKMEQGTVFAIIEDNETFPFLVHNKTDKVITVKQSDVKKGMEWICSPNEKTRFCWDSNEEMKQLLDISMDGEIIKEKFDFKVIKQIDVVVFRKEKYHFAVINKKSTRILIIEPEKAKNGFIKEIQNYNRKTEIKDITIFLKLKKIGFSLVDNSKKPFMEVFFIQLENIKASFERTDKHIYYYFSVNHLQLDDMSKQDVLIPTVIGHNVHIKEIVGEDKKVRKKITPVIRVSVCQGRDELYFRYITVNLQEIFVRIDLSFVLRINNTLGLFLPEENGDNSIRREKGQLNEKTLDSLIESIDSKYIVSGDYWNEKIGHIYFKKVILHPIKIILTFKFNKQENELIESPIFHVLKTLGFTLMNIEDVSLKFRLLKIIELFCTKNDIMDKIKTHYTRQIRHELYKIVGSLEIIGNPVGLFADVNSGIVDVFYEPINALVKDPSQIAKGIAKGTSSFVGRTVHGIFSSGGKFTKSLQRGVLLLTLDNDYIKEQERDQEAKPDGFFDGVITGGKKFGRSLYDGATGIISKPVKGARKNGLGGFLKGIGRGLVGIPTKPVAGVLSLASKTQEGISSFRTTNFKRKRCLRTFREDGLVLPYNPKKAFMNFCLATCVMDLSNEKSVRNETPIYHLKIQRKRSLILLTDWSIMYMKVSHKNKLRLKWRIVIKNISQIYSEKNGDICIVFKHRRFLNLVPQFSNGIVSIPDLDIFSQVEESEIKREIEERKKEVVLSKDNFSEKRVVIRTANENENDINNLIVLIFEKKNSK